MKTAIILIVVMIILSAHVNNANELTMMAFVKKRIVTHLIAK